MTIKQNGGVFGRNPSFNEVSAETADINGGTIDNTDVTVGAGKTLDVSAGTLTLANDQISGDKVEGGTIAATAITALTNSTINGTAIPSNSVLVNNTDLLVQPVDVAENATFSRTFDIGFEESAKVMVTYGSRDSSGTRLFTEGYVVAGQGVTSYFETVAGDKTSANTGSISITAGGGTGDFTVAKTAGSTSGSGVLQIMIVAANVTQA